MNKVIIMGRLGADPELRKISSGAAVCEVSIATSGGKDKTDWHKVTLWEQQAELIATQKKGSNVLIEGALKTDKYTDKDGNERYKTYVRAYRFEFCESKPRSSAPPTGGGATPGGNDWGDDDLRF